MKFEMHSDAQYGIVLLLCTADVPVNLCSGLSYRGITKYHSNQYVRCWKKWQTDESVDVLCASGAYEKVFWWFLDLNQLSSNCRRMQVALIRGYLWF